MSPWCRQNESANWNCYRAVCNEPNIAHRFLSCTVLGPSLPLLLCQKEHQRLVSIFSRCRLNNSVALGSVNHEHSTLRLIRDWSNWMSRIRDNRLVSDNITHLTYKPLQPPFSCYWYSMYSWPCQYSSSDFTRSLHTTVQKGTLKSILHMK